MIRAHIRIPGSEQADRRALYESFLITIAGAPAHAVEMEIRAKSGAARAEARTHPGFGKRRAEWCRTTRAHNVPDYTTYTRQIVQRALSTATPGRTSSTSYSNVPHTDTQSAAGSGIILGTATRRPYLGNRLKKSFFSPCLVHEIIESIFD